jgi:hypothetical protein
VPEGTTGGTGGVGGTSGGTPSGGTIGVGANGPRGGSDGEGGTNGSDADGEGDVVITRGGCSLANATDHSPLAALFVALAALLRIGRRRRSKSGG